MLKKILLGVLAIIAVLAAIIAVQPSEFRVERTTVVAAPPSTLFAHVNDLHKWQAWSPWAKLDPAAKVSFEGPEAGVGAVFNWSGNEQVGEGRMTVVESIPDDRVKTEVAMVKPFEGKSASEFDLTPAGDQTAITWAMTGHHGFVGKALCLIMDGKGMLGAEMEKGLAQLKQVIEGEGKAPNPS